MPESLRRTLAIFRKDARHLWPHASIFAALLVFAAVSDPAYTGPRNAAYHFYLQHFALPAACWMLIAMAIHEDRLVGDRQYWLARPYARKELFAAKALFVLAFVTLPVLIEQVGVLAINGISPAAHWRALAGNQITLAVFLILPGAALAAVTRNLAQMVTGALIVSAAMFWFLFFRPRGGFASPQLFLTPAGALAIAAGTAAVLVMQYAFRRTAPARAAVAATVLLLLLVASREQLEAIDHWRNPIRWRDDVRIQFDPSPSRRVAAFVPKPGSGPLRLEVPLRVSGLPAGLDIATDDMALGLRGPGIPLGSGANRASGIRLDSAGQAWLTAYIKSDDFDSVGDAPVDLYGSMDLSIFREQQTIELRRNLQVTVPGVGVCGDRPIGWLLRRIECLSPKPRASVQFESPDGQTYRVVPPGLLTGQGFRPMMSINYGLMHGRILWGNQRPLPSSTGPMADFRGFTVLDNFAVQFPADEDDSRPGRLIVRTPIDHFRVPFNLYSLRMRDYVAGRSSSYQ